MKIERLIEEGLLLGGSGKADMEGMATRDRGSMHMHGRRCSPAHYFPIAHHVLSLEACFWSSCSLKLLKRHLLTGDHHQRRSGHLQSRRPRMKMSDRFWKRKTDELV